jgi:hypothetical protein
MRTQKIVMICKRRTNLVILFFPFIAISAGRVPLTGRRARSGFHCRSRCEAAPRCTTRLENAHNTEFRELLYPRHPWSGPHCGKLICQETRSLQRCVSMTVPATLLLPGAGALIMQTLLTVLFLHGRPGDRAAIRPAHLACVLPKCAGPQRSSPSPPDHVEALICCRYVSLSQEKGPSRSQSTA